MSSAAAGGKVDAFALMRAAAKSKPKQPAVDDAAAGDDGDDDDTAMAGPNKGAKHPSNPTPAPGFKGSGLGAGPRHVVDPGPSLSLAALLMAKLWLTCHDLGHSQPTLG